MNGRARSKIDASPPTMIVSWPFSAPACPPDSGASRKPTPLFRRSRSDLAGHFCRGRGRGPHGTNQLGRRARGNSLTVLLHNKNCYPANDGHDRHYEQPCNRRSPIADGDASAE